MIFIGKGCEFYCIFTCRQIKVFNGIAYFNSTLSNNIVATINDLISNTGSIHAFNRNDNRLAVDDIHILAPYI